MRDLKPLKIIASGAVSAVAVVALGVALVYAMRPPPIVASGQPDPFTVWTAILVVGYFLFPVLALLVAVLLLLALLLLLTQLIGSRRTPADGEAGADRPLGWYQRIVRSTGLYRPGQEWAVPALMVLFGAVSLGVFYLAFTTLRAGDTMHIDVTPLSTAFAFVAGLAIASGVLVVLRLREFAVGARFTIAVGGLVFGALAIFSIGVLILPVALLLLVFGIRHVVRRGSGAAARAATAGAVAGVGAVAYLLVLIQPAAAECRANGGGSTSSGGLFGPMALSSGGYSSPNGESGGYIDEGDRVAYFSCRDGTLTDFHRESLPLGDWVVTTQPAATVGRTVTVVFRVRPAAGEPVPTDGFDFSVTCRTCAEPRPIVRGHADRSGTRAPGTLGASVTFAGQVVFPTAGSWYTSPYDGPIEVR